MVFADDYLDTGNVPLNTDFRSAFHLNVGDNTDPQSHLHIAPDFVIHFTDPMPCWWWRFWQWLLLGWRWDKE